MHQTDPMHTPVAYLNFPGTCEEAFNFYKQIFGGSFDVVSRFSEMPAEFPVPPGYGDKLMHISLTVKDSPFLMGSDAPEGFGEPLRVGNNVTLSVAPADEDQARRWFKSLSEGGEVTMELAPTFWAQLFGMVRDRFGINWMVSFGNPGE